MMQLLILPEIYAEGWPVVQLFILPEIYFEGWPVEIGWWVVLGLNAKA